MDSNDKKPNLGLLLLIAAGFFLGLAFFYPDSKTKIKRSISAHSPEADALVNKHLWMTNQTQEIAKARMKSQLFYAPKVGDSVRPKGNSKGGGTGVDHSPDKNETNAYEDLKRDRQELRATDPDSVIQGQIADQQKMKEYQKAYQAEFARQFVENARKNGYEVQLDADYVVISVTPIAKPERNPSVFEGGSVIQAQ